MAKEKTKESKLVVCYDHQRRTCIKVHADDETKMIHYIPLDISGFEVHKTSFDSFKQRFTPMVDYPADRACRLYLGYCTTVGATKEVIDHLARVIDVNQHDRETAISKFGKTDDNKTQNPKPKKSSDSKPAKADKKTTVKKATKKTDGKRSSAAQMFRELIMEGKLTDDKIFEKVQAEFGLDDSRRSYVEWYRKDLKKKGENPPEAK